MTKKNLTLCFLSSLILTSFTACSKKGNDGGGTKLTVHALNGFLYKAVMGTSSLDNDLLFHVVNDDGANAGSVWVHFSLLTGDGSLGADSLQTPASGLVTATYTFDGLLGHAEIMAYVRNQDTIMVSVRANTLIPGAIGQAQFVLFSDRYRDVLDWLGPATSLDTYDSWPIIYVNYESSLGVVVVLDDLDMNRTFYDTSSVLGVIVNGVYTGKTKDSIGIGSTMGDVQLVYGTVPEEDYDPTPPPAYSHQYPALGLTFYTDTTSNRPDRIVFEIHLSELISK